MTPTSDPGVTADPRLSSPTAGRLFRQATTEFNQRRFAAAAHALTSVLALAPDNPTALKMMAVASQRLGNHAGAVECFLKTTRTWPEDPMLRIGLGVSLTELDRGEEAIEQFRLACKLAPSFADAWYDLGEALARQSYAQEAATALQKALALSPDHLLARLSLARVWTNFGQLDEAVKEFREVLRRDPDNAEGWFGLSYLNTDCFEPGDFELLARALERPGRPADEQERLWFVQAKLLEMRGDYIRAFDAFRAANELGRKRVRWNPAAAHERAEAVLRAFQGEIQSPPDTEFGREAILIASMPRSGSSLVEQILASHPDVEGANEIKSMAQILEAETRRRRSLFPSWIPDASAQDWSRLGHEYLALTSRWRETKPRFTDKSLANWLFAGTALSMLPGARVIVVRRDPVETCLACYRQCLGSMYGFACDLADAADYYIDFMRLTCFWIQKHPDRVMDLEYETLVAEPDATIRRLLDFCDLPFDPACLAFHETRRAVQSLPSAVQIRQGMRSDTARAACYGHQLDALRARLRAGGIQLADDP